MTVSVVLLPFLLIMMLVGLAIPVLLGVYVYKDAKSRNMDAVLWTLIAVLVPSLIGFVIYLVVRRDQVALSCPNCSADVAESYTVCPSCGQHLQAACKNCGTPIKSDWKLCPHCGQEITDVEDFMTPVPKKSNAGKGLLIALAAIIIVPIIICIAGVAVFSVNKAVINNSDVVEAEELRMALFDDSPVVVKNVMECDLLTDGDKAWITECQKGEKGIYSRPINPTTSSGAMINAHTDKELATHKCEYGYVIIVVNSPEGKACNYVVENHIHSGLAIASNISIVLNEVDAVEGDEYNNVFVVQYLRSFSADIASKENGADKVISVDEDFDDKKITLMISKNYDYNTNDKEYSISTEKEGFIAIKTAE